ncbi:hypothetical protein U3516DRAFT_768736 [Neocallimastix sp. 'constans']
MNQEWEDHQFNENEEKKKKEEICNNSKRILMVLIYAAQYFVYSEGDDKNVLKKDSLIIMNLLFLVNLDGQHRNNFEERIEFANYGGIMELIKGEEERLGLLDRKNFQIVFPSIVVAMQKGRNTMKTIMLMKNENINKKENENINMEENLLLDSNINDDTENIDVEIDENENTENIDSELEE